MKLIFNFYFCSKIFQLWNIPIICFIMYWNFHPMYVYSVHPDNMVTSSRRL